MSKQWKIGDYDAWYKQSKNPLKHPILRGLIYILAFLLFLLIGCIVISATFEGAPMILLGLLHGFNSFGFGLWLSEDPLDPTPYFEFSFSLPEVPTTSKWNSMYENARS